MVCLVFYIFSPTNILRLCIPWFSSLIPHSSIPQLHFGIIPFIALNPLFDVVCHSRGLVGLCFPLGTSWSSGFHPLFHPCICNGSVTLLHHIDCCPYLSLSPSPNNWAWHAECNILAFLWISPSLRDHLPKNKTASPGAWTMASVILSSRPS